LDTGNGLYDLLFEQGRQFEDLSEVGQHLIGNEQKDIRNDREELVAAALESARQKIVKLKQASIRIGQLEQEREVALEAAKKNERTLEQAMVKVSASEQERGAASPLRSFLEKKFRKT
jgi:ribosome-binding ATPase YchF (GTP1/OBG family)